MAIIKMELARYQIPQIRVIEEANIPKNRMSDLANDKDAPRPDEIKRIAEALGNIVGRKYNKRRLGYRYCSGVCELGTYPGYRFDEIDLKTAGLNIISNLFGIETILPHLASQLSTNSLTPEIMARLNMIKLSILALEVQYSEGSVKVGSRDAAVINQYLDKKKNRLKSG
jgi:hypothetical protein